jgi:CubicO group peptidase (beta-lactamase class C family)
MHDRTETSWRRVFHALISRVGPVLVGLTLAQAASVAQAAPRAPQQASPAEPAKLEAANPYAAAFEAWRAANDPQTAILVIRRHSKIVASLGHNADATGPTLIGSMSKAITAACTATLIRDGKLAFTTPMRDALSDFFGGLRPLDPRFEEVTVEQLLTHRSGLHDNGKDDPLVAIRRERIAERLADVASPQPMLAAYVSQNPLVSAPGSAFVYSNTGYLALSAVIEERSGRPFQDYCRDAVFVPLGLASAQLHPDWRMFGGFGGWYITGADYLAFYEIFSRAHPFLGKTVKAWIDAVRGRWGANGESDWYSLGVRTSARDGGWSVHHTGTLGWHAHNAQGQPIDAVINGLASRDPSGTGIFIAATPRPGDTSMRNKVYDLQKKIARIAAAMHP